MTLADLIDQLNDMAETYGGHVEVRIAEQPNYPFENEIAGVVAGEQIVDEEGDSFDEAVYILEGAQIGYFTKNAWNEV